LIAGYGVAVASGSRPLGGLVLAACGLVCLSIWLRRDGRRTAAMLTAAGLFAFAFSHVAGLVIGAWPAVLLVAAAIGWLCRRLSDSGSVSASDGTRRSGSSARRAAVRAPRSGRRRTGSSQSPSRAR